MTSLCEVCATEPSKYRCPTCELMSCSLACTQSHKIYCAPKPPLTKASDEAITTNPSSTDVNGHVCGETIQEAQNDANWRASKFSSQVKDLLKQYPSLRGQLQDIYKATLQEEWVESSVYGDKARHFGRGKPVHRNHGPWTREKGFNRGLGKVRKYRERCEDGTESGGNAEGFMQLVNLVNEDHTS